MSEAIPADQRAVRILYAGDELTEGPAPNDISTADESFAVRWREDFVEALDCVEAGECDCAVTSHCPDGFDGIAFLEAVRRGHPDFPVVLLPADRSDADARRAVDADVTAFIPATAPDALDAIVETVENEVDATRDDNTRMPISDLTSAEERQLKERALDEAMTGITISDAKRPDNPIIYANERFEEMTGYSRDEVIGANHRFLQGPKTDPDRVAELGRAIAEKRDVRVVLRNYTKDGEVFWNQVDVSPITDESGEVTHFIGFQMDVTERERIREQLEAERETLDRVLDRVNGIVRDVTETFVRANSRAEIERRTVERFREGDEYGAAWLGRFDETEDEVTVTCGTSGDDPSTVVDLDRFSGNRPLREAVESQTTHVIEDPTRLPYSGDWQTAILVPLSYRSSTYGVLAVFDDDQFDERERVLLEGLGRSIGTAINDTLTKRTLSTDTVFDVALEVLDVHFLPALANDLGCDFDHEAIIKQHNGEGLIVVISTEYSDGGQIVDSAETVDEIDDVRILVEDETGCVVQFRVAESPLLDALSEAGCRLTSLRTDGSSLEVEFQAGTEAAARRALETLRDEYASVELTEYHEIDEPPQTPHSFRDELRNRLTERQLTALRKAYVSGFFEWPRRSDGEQLAESMDIVPSTYHQHLQAAKRKLVEAFFEE